jgi:type IV pilus assembly protein PilA
MFCNHCGNQLPDNSTYCNNCGANLQTTVPNVPYPVVPPPGTLAGENVPTDGKATASLILGILSVTVLSILAGIPAVILGHMSRSNIKKSMGKLKGEGLALAGLIMGYISLLSIPVILIIAAIAIPNLLRARQHANEAAAIGAIRTINTAAVTYISETNSYPETLADLEQKGYIDATLASGTKSGYRFEYSAVDGDGDGTREHYSVIAIPMSMGASGNRSFCSDESAVIRYEHGSGCTSESRELNE